MRKFPKEVFVRKDPNDSGPENLLAFRDRDGAVEDGGVTEGAVYELVTIKKLRKKVVDA